MDDLISRQAAINAIRKIPVLILPGGVHLGDVLRTIRRLPSAQPEPKRGKWIDRGVHGDWEWQADGRGKYWHEWECNTCHHYFDERTFFCPHCGCDMRGEQYGRPNQQTGGD